MDDLWDKLSTIAKYSKTGAQKMNSFKQFGSIFNLHVKIFADGLRKASTKLDDDMGHKKLTMHKNDFLDDE